MPDGTDTITTIHFVLMALLAVAVVVAIAYGVKLKRARIAGQREFEANAEEAGVVIGAPEPEDEAPAPPVAPPPPTPVPVAPFPAPLVGQTVPGTPPEITAPAFAPEADRSAPEPLAEAAPDIAPLVDEPIAASVAPDGTTVTLAADAATAADGPDPADGPLTDIKGLGPRVAARLNELGIDRIGQLATLDAAAAADLDAHMGPFTGRMARDRWIEQARLLAAGDRAGFEAAFGKLG